MTLLPTRHLIGGTNLKLPGRTAVTIVGVDPEGRRIGTLRLRVRDLRAAAGDGLTMILRTAPVVRGRIGTAAHARFGEADDAFTRWFKAEVKSIHGVDLDAPPSGAMPSLVVDTGG